MHSTFLCCKPSVCEGQAAGATRQEMGVYVGVSYNEYSQLAAAQGPGMSSYTATGGSLSVAAGLTPLNMLHREPAHRLISANLIWTQGYEHGILCCWRSGLPCHHRGSLLLQDFSRKVRLGIISQRLGVVA